MRLPPPDEIERTARQVLESDDYHLRYEKDLMEPVWHRMFEFFMWCLKQFANFVNSIQGIPFALRWTIVVALFILLIVLVVHIIYSLVVSARPIALAKSGLVEDRYQQLDPNSLEAEAQSLIEQERLIEAVRFLLRASLLRLEASFDRSFRNATTNREYLRKYRKLPIADSFQMLVDRIDRSWYGEEPFDFDELQKCRDAHRQITNYVQRSTS